MKKILSKSLFFYFLPIVFLFAACSGDDENADGGGDANTPYKVTYRISTLRSSDANASDDEMMKSIFLVIVKSDGTIEEIVDIDLPSTQEEHTVEMQLTPGKKSVYGFANLSDAMKAESGLSALAIDNTMPDLSAATLTIANGYTIDEAANQYLPMSNSTSFTVANISGQLFNLELIRIVSKVKFTFKNESGKNITLKQLVMSPLTISPVCLMPRDISVPVFPAGTTQGNYSYTFGSGYTFADGGQLEYTTYINESAITGTGWFQVRLTTETGNGGISEERIALTDLTSINRNDYLNLPIILTDYKLDIDVRSYPPIGGYPASVVYENDAYHVTFSGGGPFVIVPKLVQLSDNTEVAVADNDWSFTYTDTAPSFFEEAPVLEDGEIHGIIDPAATGSVLVTLSAQVTTSAGMQRTVSYKIYINQN